MLRTAVQSYTPLGRTVSEFINRGQLVPDETMVEMVKERLGHPDTSRGFMLDGFPRTTRQAEALESIFVAQGRKADGVIVLSAPTEALVERIAGRRMCESCQASFHVSSRPPTVKGVCDRCGGTLIQRSDDAEATVRYRLEEYAAKTPPVLDYFKTHGWPVKVIDAIGDIDQVFGRIYAAVLP
jgi:adenylate kinase